jgi:succinate dehydrogenase/fumarate reductase flavoprotein subunit
MVFGARLAETILGGGDGPTASGVLAPVLDGRVEVVDTPATVTPAGPADLDGLDSLDGSGAPADVGKARDLLQRAMTDGAGVVRSSGSLAHAGRVVAAVADAVAARPADRAGGELANLLTAARSVLASATMRVETRGAHARSDFPQMSEAWRCRIVHSGLDRHLELAAATGDAEDSMADRSPR